MSLRVVLIEPSHSGNIGATARAMGNMGVSRLYLVNPENHLNDVATARSSGNEHILQNAIICNSMEEAISDCSHVFGTSARLRTIAWPSKTPRKAMKQAALASAGGKQVALLFGPERTGLTNQAVERCTALVRIPVNETSPSINLAGAVLIMLYEYQLACLKLQSNPEVSSRAAGEELATSEQVHGFFEHLEQVVREVEFIGNHPHDSLMRKIKRIFIRSRLTHDDVNILRGILTAVNKKVDK